MIFNVGLYMTTNVGIYTTTNVADVTTKVAVYNATNAAGYDDCAAKFFECPIFRKIWTFRMSGYPRISQIACFSRNPWYSRNLRISCFPRQHGNSESVYPRLSQIAWSDHGETWRKGGQTWPCMAVWCCLEAAETNCNIPWNIHSFKTTRLRNDQTTKIAP